MSIMALIWSEESQKLRDRSSQKEEEQQQQGVSSSVQPQALTSQSTSHGLEILTGDENSNNNVVAANSATWFSSSAVNKMMDCFCP